MDRREFLTLAGVSAGSLALTGCGGGGSDAPPAPSGSSPAPTPSPTPTPTPTPAPTPTPTPEPTPEPTEDPPSNLSPEMQALKAHLQAKASPTFALPALRASRPTIRWSGPVANPDLGPPATTMPSGVIIPVTHPSIGGPCRNRLAPIAGNFVLNGHPCLTIGRPYTCRGMARNTTSRASMRIRTDAPAIEFTGVVGDGGPAIPVLIVDGELVPPVALSASRGAGGTTAGTIVVDFGTRAMRDIWIETAMYLAHIKIDALDTLADANDQSEPQLTAIGDSYMQTHTNTFPFDGAIAQEIGARLGIRKVAVDAIGGTGYYNTGGNLGNLNDRLPAHADDNSIVYLVAAGLNDYGDINGLPTRAAYEASIYDYIRNLRDRQPKALIVILPSFCPVPPLSDSSYVSGSTNTSGQGDFLWTAFLHKDAIKQIAGPWIYVDVLMGGGWLNSSGASGDITNLQWFTGGQAPQGVQIGGGGGFGGIKAIPIVSGGQYSRAPNLTAVGGTGQGAVLLTSMIDSTGALSAITVHSGGDGYTDAASLPTIVIDPTYQITPAVLGTPQLTQGYNQTGNYPTSGPPGADLNNIYRYLAEDRTHPCVIGSEYLGKRLAENIYQAVMAL